ncbi:MAG TPA: TonB-dependent receptor plug domain-containing protein [Gemmatimonadaceae bacterium]|nr:TonB-dependent receptor plug domain-containing protein [Gemmatimonadaceae bacterium]
MKRLRLRRRYGFWSVVLALSVARSAAAQSRVCITGQVDTAQTQTHWTPPLDRPITLHTTDLALRHALDRVATMAKLHLSYSAELLPLDQVVCVAADAAPVGTVLAGLLRETKLAAVGVGGDQVVLAPRSNDTRESTPDMSRTIGVLDRVVVTGSADGASQRELSVGLDVVDGRQLARDNTNTLSGALDSYVPGVWSWTQSPASMLSSFASIRGASSFGLSYPKIYIDGIEVANPLLVTRFSPDAIDRIEVIRGPQGSALYGTDAISGVVNIVTRHEGASGDGTRASLRTTAGVSQSAFTHSVLAQDHSLSLVSGTSTRSADLRVSGGSIGAFIPDGYSRDLLASGSARIVGTNATLAATARFFMEQAGTPNSPLLASSMARTMGTDAINSGLVTQPADTPQSVRQYTIGTTGTFAPGTRWTHSLVAGVDGYRLANAETNLTPFPSLADSALRAAEGGADRGTLRASSVLRLVTTETSHATLTFSAEHAALRETSIRRTMSYAQPSTLGSTPPRMETSDVVTWQNSSGFTTQANASYNNTFFATGGFRIEHDSRLASSDQLVTLPMFGGAAVRDYGPFTFKLRAAYGKGIRPPATLVHSPSWQTLTNPAAQSKLGPEVQSGTEAGFDVLFGHALSLQVTRFDQRASGLAQQVVTADSAYPPRHPTYAFEDVGEISNRGWEIAAAGTMSRLAVTGALSFVGSRVTKLANGYTGDLRTGDRMLQVPASTASLTASWTGNRWFASLAGARAMDWINYDELAMTRQFSSGAHPAHELLGAQLREYWRRYDGGLRLRASASREIRDMLSIELSADNLLNYQRGEPDNITVVPGRTIMSGVRVRF